MSFSMIANDISSIIFLLFVVGIPAYGYYRRVNVYDAFIEGGKEGFSLSIQLMPYFVAMFVAVGMLRASGTFDSLARVSAPLLKYWGIPEAILPLALVRPFSGSASNGLLIDLIHTYGADSLIAKIGATIMGSTETTFYVLAIYFGAVAITRTRHALICGLCADATGIIASVWICRWLFT